MRFFLGLMFCLGLMTSAAAQVYGPPLQLDDPLIVQAVSIDVTAADAVQARDQAIIEAQRKALMILAQRNLSADDFKAFTLPPDAKIARAVSDFEISNEQIAAQRYVADFKVRFSKGVSAIIPIRQPEQPSAGLPDQVDRDIPWEEGESTAKTILVLPYLERGDGRTLLWEDDNSWLRAWQQNAPSTPVKGKAWVVPLGDIDDISAGGSDMVWSGDYTAVEKLQKNYKADEVVLAVANTAGADNSVDLYVYKEGRLSRRQAATPAVAPGVKQGAEADIFAAAMQAVFDGPAPHAQPVINTPRLNLDFSALHKAQEDTAQAAQNKTEILAGLKFNTEAEWITLQRALRQVDPPVETRIKSMTGRSVVFALGFRGDEQALKSALLRQKIMLGLPDVDLDAAQTVYDIRMIDTPRGQ